MPRGRRRRRGRGAGRSRPTTPGGPPLPPDVGGLPSRGEMDVWAQGDRERRGREGRRRAWSGEARQRRTPNWAFRAGEEMAGRPQGPVPSATPGAPVPTPSPTPTPQPRRSQAPVAPGGTPAPGGVRQPWPWERPASDPSILPPWDPRYKAWAAEQERQLYMGQPVPWRSSPRPPVMIPGVPGGVPWRNFPEYRGMPGYRSFQYRFGDPNWESITPGQMRPEFDPVMDWRMDYSA